MVVKMYKRLSGVVIILTLMSLIISGCTSQASNIGLAKENDREVIGSDFVVAEVGSYDSADTAVVVSVDANIEYVTLMNIATGKQYTLSYDGTTYVKDKYEGPMSMSQVNAGDIVDVTFLKSKKKLASIQMSPKAWKFDNVENYDLGGFNKTASIGSNTYSLPDDVLVLSEGKRAEVMDIVDKDVLTISGIDHKICSIKVEKGHGYLRLSNEQALVGGWIEVGNTVIQQVNENMLLTVPEGSYQVLLSNGNSSCVKDVRIERNKEVILNVSELEIVQDKKGKILITVEPSEAEVKIDGTVVDIDKEVELDYGIHRIRLEADGYQTLTKYIQVGSEYARLSFVMEEAVETEEEDKNTTQKTEGEAEEINNDEESEEENAEEETNNEEKTDGEVANATAGNKVYIDAPSGVEVYLNGNYIGICPVNFKKVVGSHTITLRKSGYVSRSYTIYLYDDGQDITYSFTALEKDTSSSEGSSSTSARSTQISSTTSSTTSSITSSSSSDSTVSGNDSNLTQ